MFSLLRCLRLTLAGFAMLYCTAYAHTEHAQSTTFNNTFPFDTNPSFQQYVNHTQTLLQRNHQQLQPRWSTQTAQLAAPFIWQPTHPSCQKSNRGVLLIHGLLETPYAMRSMARFFLQHCFLVYSVLLNGHGTHPEHLLHVTYQSWITQINYAMRQLAQHSSSRYIVGNSVGALLALHYPLQKQSVPIQGIVALSPALKLPFLARFSSLIGYIKPFLNRYPDQDPFKYESLTSNAVVQAYRLSQRVNAKLSKHATRLNAIDLLIAFTYEDNTIKADASLDVLLQHLPQQSQYLIYHQNNDELMARLQKHSVTLVNSQKNDILNLSHIGLPVDPSDPHYGRNGNYRNCLHYYGTPKYPLCQQTTDIKEGELNPENNAEPLMSRITYNPFIDALYSQISHLLQKP